MDKNRYTIAVGLSDDMRKRLERVTARYNQATDQELTPEDMLRIVVHAGIEAAFDKYIDAIEQTAEKLLAREVAG